MPIFSMFTTGVSFIHRKNHDHFVLSKNLYSTQMFEM